MALITSDCGIICLPSLAASTRCPPPACPHPLLCLRAVPSRLSAIAAQAALSSFLFSLCALSLLSFVPVTGPAFQGFTMEPNGYRRFGDYTQTVTLAPGPTYHFHAMGTQSGGWSNGRCGTPQHRL